MENAGRRDGESAKLISRLPLRRTMKHNKQTHHQAAQTLHLLTPTELARELRTTPQSVNGWHRKGLIPAKFALGKTVRFELSEVLDTLQNSTGKAGRA